MVSCARTVKNGWIVRRATHGQNVCGGVMGNGGLWECDAWAECEEANAYGRCCVLQGWVRDGTCVKGIIASCRA